VYRIQQTQHGGRGRGTDGPTRKYASIPGTARGIFILISVQTSTGVNPSSIEWVLWIFLREESDQSLKITSHLSNTEVKKAWAYKLL
jgi:hypothetical protein